MTRLALIGCGNDTPHCISASRRLVGARVVAVVDADVGRASHVARHIDAPLVKTSLEHLLVDHGDDFEAVVIQADWAEHATLTVEAALGGKHVLVDSPLALTVESADTAIAACAAAGVRLMVGQSLRFAPAQQTLKERLSSGKLGTPGLLRIHRWEPLASGGWGPTGLDVLREGAPFLVRAIPEIDLANWLFETRPTHVYAAGRTQSSGGLEAPDYFQIHLGFPEGGMALIDEARTLPRGDDYFSLSVIGSMGAAYADDHHNMNLLYRGGAPAALNANYGDLHVLSQLEEFIRAITEAREPAIRGADGRAAIEVAIAAAESMESGRSAVLAGDNYELS